MLFQNVATLETVVELILQPEETLAMLRAEVEKNRVDEPEEEGEEGAGGGGGEADGAAAAAPSSSAARPTSPGGDKISPEPAETPQFVDADETEDRKKQSSTSCSNTGCVIC